MTSDGEDVTPVDPRHRDDKPLRRQSPGGGNDMLFMQSESTANWSSAHAHADMRQTPTISCLPVSLVATTRIRSSMSSTMAVLASSLALRCRRCTT